MGTPIFITGLYGVKVLKKPSENSEEGFCGVGMHSPKTIIKSDPTIGYVASYTGIHWIPQQDACCPS